MLSWNEWQNHILNLYLPFLTKSPLFCLICTLFGQFLGTAKRAHRLNCVLRGSTVRLIRVLCLYQVLGLELTCPLVHCSDCLSTLPGLCISFLSCWLFFLGKVFHHYRHFFYHLTGTSSNHTVSARSPWPHWPHILLCCGDNIFLKYICKATNLAQLFHQLRGNLLV